MNWRHLLGTAFTTNSTTGIAKFFALVFICSTTIFLTQDHVRSRDLFSQPAIITTKQPTIQFETIELADAIRYSHRQGVIFLDVREKQYYDYGHIERAQNIPIEQISKLTDAEVQSWKAAPTIIVYCNGVSCGIAYQAAKLLMAKGIDNVKIYVEGWPEWRSCKLPITMSEQMKQDVAKEKP